MIVDAYSKWLKVFRMPNLTLQAIIARLRRLFVAYRLPEHKMSFPGHPATKGLAEGYVQTFESGLKKYAHLTMDLEDKISLFLQKFCHDQRAVERSFSAKDAVYLCNTTGGGNKLVPSVIVNRTSVLKG